MNEKRSQISVAHIRPSTASYRVQVKDCKPSDANAANTSSFSKEKTRIVLFDRPRAPWRNSYEEALADAVALELAFWDQSKREWFLAVLAAVQVRRVPVLVRT